MSAYFLKHHLKVKDIKQRTSVLQYLKDNGVQATFHYVPLHSSPAGEKYSEFCGLDEFTTKESERLLRLPLWYGISNQQQETVVKMIYTFFETIISADE